MLELARICVDEFFFFLTATIKHEMVVRMRNELATPGWCHFRHQSLGSTQGSGKLYLGEHAP